MVEAFFHPVSGSLVETSVEALAEALLATRQEMVRLRLAAAPLEKWLAELYEPEDAAMAPGNRSGA